MPPNQSPCGTSASSTGKEVHFPFTGVTGLKNNSGHLCYARKSSLGRKPTEDTKIEAKKRDAESLALAMHGTRTHPSWFHKPVNALFCLRLDFCHLKPKTPEYKDKTCTHSLRADVQSVADCDSKALGPFKAPFPGAVRAIYQKQDVRCSRALHH